MSLIAVLTLPQYFQALQKPSRFSSTSEQRVHEEKFEDTFKYLGIIYYIM